MVTVNSALIDARGRVWHWVCQLRPGVPSWTGYRHRAVLRSREQLDADYGELIAVADPVLLSAMIVPTPTYQIALRDSIVVTLAENRGVSGVVTHAWAEDDRYHRRIAWGVGMRNGKQAVVRRALDQQVLRLRHVPVDEAGVV